jgi:hypothetical protein
MARAHVSAAPTSGVSLDRFLSPEAMLTPGAAGGVIVLISNALAVNFSLPRSHVGLALSFIFGLLAMTKPQQWYLKATYYFLNSMIIFCVAFGAGSLSLTSGAPNPSTATIFAPAYADEPQKPADPAQLNAPPQSSNAPAPTAPPSNPPPKTPTTPKGWSNPFVGPCSIITNPLGKNC